MINRSRCFILFSVSAIAIVVWLSPFSASQAFPVFPAGFVHETVIAEGLDLPTAMAFGPSGSLFIAEKRGVVRVWKDGALLSEPFVDLVDEVNQSGDRGLLGLALHPQFPATPYVYLLYVYDPPGAPPDGEGARVARLLRVTADAANPFKATDERIVLLGRNSTLAHSGNPHSQDDQVNVACQNAAQGAERYVQDCLPDDFPAHTIGTVAFGPDGKLYVGNGDGASWKSVDPRSLRVQSIHSLAGKLLRIDPLTGAGLADNPFYDGNLNSNASKVFNYGLRSPFRFTFHPTNGEVFIGDVGWGTWEEINVGRGKNFGWPCYEGGDGVSERQELYADNPVTSAPCQQLYEADSVTPPLYGYGREDFGASLTMGVFYTGTAWPTAFRGALFFADYSNNWIRYLTPDGKDAAQGRPTVNRFSSDDFPISGPVQLLIGPDEQLYYIGLGEVTGIYRIRYTGTANQPPVAKISADVLQGASPLTVTFSSAGSLDPEGQPLSFAWTFGDGTSSNEATPRKTFDKAGNYLVRLTVSDVAGLTHSDALAIIVGNSRPVITLQAPLAETLYATGDEIRFSAMADDAEEGDLSARVQWKALLHHNEHTHFDFLNFTGAAGTFAIPDHGDHTRFELCANVTDGAGASSQTVCRELRPQTVILQFNSVPVGATINYEGVTYVTPFTITAIANSQREISAPVSYNGLNYLNWADNGARSRTFNTGYASQTFTVLYDAPTAALGLRGDYFDTPDLALRRFTRLDSQIDFDWGTNAPDARLGRDMFSVRWRGQVQPLYDETYTFYTLSDEGVRLWVNGQLLINNWTNHFITEDSATITLRANVRYDLQLEYHERLGTAVMKLFWSSASQTKEIVPASRLSQPVAFSP
ncbi:MAG: PKD domain-containing protein [Acidobacteria bacterium]|nr:PKD domain-containing protein [Acidobacteriota bacterium]